MVKNTDEGFLAIIKISSMVIMFLMILIVGLLPIRSKAFKSNKMLLSFTAAFSGGLFLAVGMIHLLPEAQEQIEQYYEDQVTDKLAEKEDHFPIVFLITTLSFALILWIEKIATGAHHEHYHEHNDASLINQQYLVDPESLLIAPKRDIYDADEETDLAVQESAFKNAISTQAKIAKKASFLNANAQLMLNNPKASMAQKQLNKLAPYILQIAIGSFTILLKGLAIGIEQDVSSCLGIAVAVVCHKWAEGLTLGLAFRQAEIEVNMASTMILIQAIMNPVGIGLGWILSSQGLLVTSIFESISAGTFIYIATVEVIVEEFNIARYKWQKFVFFLIAIAFISSIWYLEKLTESK